MSSQANLFYNKTTKAKYSSINMYQTDGFKSSNLSELKKPKTSMSPNRMILSKSAKNNPILPMMKSYNNNTFKIKDHVYIILNIIKIY